MLARDQFVDLYELLELPVDADAGKVRERINHLYLEAQRNIDHHNFRKRFYYQELFEVHLPQAHDFLLNPDRRKQYDRYLEAFRAGQPFPTDIEVEPEPDAVIEAIPAIRSDVEPAPGSPTLPSTDMVGAVLPNQDSVNTVLPAYDEAQATNATAEPSPSREELWKKWKTGLDKTIQADEESAAAPNKDRGPRRVPSTAKKTARPDGTAPPLPGATPRTTARTTATPARTTAAATTPAARAASAPAARPASDGAAFFPTKPWVGIPPDEVERRRDGKRRDLIKHELQTANTKYRLAGGTFTLAIGGVGLYSLYSLISSSGKHTSGLTLDVVMGVGLAVVVQLSLMAANTASREVRRRIIAQLSKMPYDELLKRCKV